MKIQKEIRTYCPYCNKHTVHTIKHIVSPKPANPTRGLSMSNRRHERKIKGYVGKVKAKTPKKKLGTRQKVTMECKDCHKSIERVIGGRTKKKLEIKR
ncbi:MAG: 50S ribosomal protein L44e [Candidatus Micrarchaeota archaeon]|nr:50S ribosomal protein L44e [Candidatus Micrarchaeota archaeon]MDE1847482.1 50S ribosomal protein L44e [Candidatus Micrarchaeota archaeon]MDE1864023.1 50S ribosomal protein L44e [Candidatus Micrarchaeota archaeon]